MWRGATSDIRHRRTHFAPASSMLGDAGLQGAQTSGVHQRGHPFLAPTTHMRNQTKGVLSQVMIIVCRAELNYTVRDTMLFNRSCYVAVDRKLTKGSDRFRDRFRQYVDFPLEGRRLTPISLRLPTTVKREWRSRRAIYFITYQVIVRKFTVIWCRCGCYCPSG